MHIVLGSQNRLDPSISIGAVGTVEDITQDWPDVQIGISCDGPVAVIVKGAECQAKYLAESANRVKML